MAVNKRATILALTAFLAAAGQAFAGSEHAFGRAAGNCGGMWPVADTGQTVHYSTAAGDDSDYRPAASQPSYSVFYGGIETSSYTLDNRTGLIWATNPSDVCSACGGGYVSSGTYTWEAALQKCESLNYAGYTDWRLPNAKELVSISDYGRQNPSINTVYFLNTQSDFYWSSTTYNSLTSYAWHVKFDYGRMNNNIKGGTYYVRCVRGGV